MILLKLIEPLGALLSYLKFKRDRLRLEKLINRGLKVGKNVYIGPNVRFDEVYPFLIEVGDNCRISSETIFLAHDATTFKDIGITRIAPVRILNNSLIGTNSIILPGVTIGPNAIIAAGSVVNRNIEEGKMAAGNPARPYSNYNDLLEKYFSNANKSRIFAEEELENGSIKHEDIWNALQENPIVFMRGIPSHDHYYFNTDMDYIKQKSNTDFNNLMKLLEAKSSDKLDKK